MTPKKTKFFYANYTYTYLFILSDFFNLIIVYIKRNLKIKLFSEQYKLSI
jgi:hypothetical protein